VRSELRNCEHCLINSRLRTWNFPEIRRCTIDRSCYSYLIALLILHALILAPPAFAGVAFGIYDARTLAMGGASVASSNNDNAQFYNSALLAFNDDIEERTQDSRFLFPVLVPQIADSAFTVEEIARDDLSGAASRAIDLFNADPSAANAQFIVDITANLDASLAAIDGEDLFADVYVGLAISEPGQFQGAGFFLGTRLLAGGAATVSATDRALLAAYQEGLGFIASGGTLGAAHPELFDANGALFDPGNNFDSTASAVGVSITEVGVAMSRQLRLFGHPVAAGFSFKALRVDTFEDEQRVVVDRIDVNRNSETKSAVNFDLGFARDFGNSWRVGLAVKDIIPRNYETTLGTVVRLRPRPRIGARYKVGGLQVSADADLIRGQLLGGERPTQEAAVGAEWSLHMPIKLRAGYRQDIQFNRSGIVSVGVGTLWKRLAVDLAYAGGADTTAGALQFGIAF